MSSSTSNVKLPSTAREAFLIYSGRGIVAIPVNFRTKHPVGEDWLNQRPKPEDVDRLFPSGRQLNIAVLNGEPSGNQLDADLDVREAVLAAPFFLPATDMIFGRKSHPSSHRIYRTDQPLDKEKVQFLDPVKTGTEKICLLELRGGGGMTVFPPSAHKDTGEVITWERFGDPSPVKLDDVVRAGQRLAAATLIARNWPTTGGRHEASKALAGGLLRILWPREDVEQFMSAVATAAGDEELRARVRNVISTAGKIENNEPATGWPTLKELLPNGETVVNTVLEWLGAAGSRHSPSAVSLEWTDPIPLGVDPIVPEFPIRLLPRVLADWVCCEAEATQTPPDLAGLLSLGMAGAAVAGRFRVQIREGWKEPLNLFLVAALPPGERKSAVFGDAMVPTIDYEMSERERLRPLIAEAATEHRQMEARLKTLEAKIAKADDAADLEEEAKKLARELAEHKVPAEPQLHCDDATPEILAKLLSDQGGRMLQASPEGTAFEIVKGRYSGEAGKGNFEVYLKGHAGDPLRVNRVGRDADIVPCPALSVALAVQPDVIRGLADHGTLRHRGFLARYLYGMPVSMVGSRKVAARPVPHAIRDAYRDLGLSLWRLEAEASESMMLTFSDEADGLLRDFETWLEPRLAEGEELSFLAGWANKLAGACARIAGIFHLIGNTTEWRKPLEAGTVEAAIHLGRDYLLPHAQAAFRVMGADKRTGLARVVWDVIRRKVESDECVEDGVRRVSRRDIHQWNRRRAESVNEIDPIIAFLEDCYYLRNVGDGRAGRGTKGPTYLVNPKAMAEHREPRTQRTQRTQPDASHDPNRTSAKNPVCTQPDSTVLNPAPTGVAPGEVEYVEYS